MAIVTGKNQRWRLLATHVALWALIVVTLFPLFAVVSISLRPGNFSTGSLIPDHISFEHWSLALGIPYTQADGTVVQPPFPVLRWLWNSVKVATLSALLIVAISTTAAYGFARLKFRHKSSILNGMMLLQMFPVAAAVVAVFAIFEGIGHSLPWLGIETHAGLIVAYLGGVAMHIWTIKGYFETIPTDIEENAKVDGATHWQAFRLVLLPMAVPILMVVFVLAREADWRNGRRHLPGAGRPLRAQRRPGGQAHLYPAPKTAAGLGRVAHQGPLPGRAQALEPGDRLLGRRPGQHCQPAGPCARPGRRRAVPQPHPPGLHQPQVRRARLPAGVARVRHARRLPAAWPSRPMRAA
jgi:maltose/maltodextrin transport system permease protein